MRQVRPLGEIGGREKRSSLILVDVEEWSWRRELNPRPSDYKSDALPTELRQLIVLSRELRRTHHHSPVPRSAVERETGIEPATNSLEDSPCFENTEHMRPRR